MYVGPWQEFKAIERARLVEQQALAQQQRPPAPDQTMADELERLRRALELVSGELPPEAATKVRARLSFGSPVFLPDDLLEEATHP